MNTSLTIVPRLQVSTILVADDDPAIVQLVEAVLKAEGYQVLAAQGPLDALHIAEQPSAHVDLLLSDIEMPGMDGTILWREVKRCHPHAKVVLMSGTVDLAFVPCVPFLRKPFTVSQLTTKVKNALHSEPMLRASSRATYSPAEHRCGYPRAAGPTNRGTDDAA